MASAALPSYLPELLAIDSNRQGEGLAMAPGTGHCQNPSQQTTLAAARDDGVVNFVTGPLT